MTNLAEKSCEACTGEAPLASQAEIDEYKQKLPDWDIIEVDGIKRLNRAFKFKNFKQALDFANRVGDIAEQENHHPAIGVEWGKTTVTWWSHKIGGLHVNDFIMAAKTDELS